MFKNISIIGVGNLTQTLLFCIKNTSTKLNINLYDLDNKKRVFASSKEWSFNSKIDKKINDCDLIIIAVKPTQYKKVCNAINNYVNKKLVVVSMMAGVKTKDLKDKLSGEVLIARVMTNINAKFGNAISSIYMEKRIKKNDITSLRNLFSLFGSVRFVKTEAQIDKITALLGSGPAYFIYFAESIVKAFQSFGYSKDESNNLVAELFYGTAKMCILDERSFEQIKKTVISKGGTTEAALKNLDNLKTKEKIKKSIKKAYVKAQALGKNK